MTDKKDRFPPLMSQEELETSDFGRNPKFPPGWFVGPVAVLCAVFWFFVVKWLLS